MHKPPRKYFKKYSIDFLLIYLFIFFYLLILCFGDSNNYLNSSIAFIILVIIAILTVNISKSIYVLTSSNRHFIRKNKKFEKIINKVGKAKYKIDSIFKSFILVLVYSIFVYMVFLFKEANNPIEDYWVFFIPITGFVSGSNTVYSTKHFFFTLLFSIVAIISAKIINNQLLMVLGNTIKQILYLVCFSSILHYLLRKLYSKNIYTHFLNELTFKLRSNIKLTLPFINGSEKESILDSNINQIAEFIGINLGYDHVHIVLHNKEQNTFVLKGVFGYIQCIENDFSWTDHEEKSITGWVFNNKKYHLCPDTSKCKLYKQTEGIYTSSELSVPIISKGECIGIIDVQSEKKYFFDKTDAEILQLIADAISLSIMQNEEIIEKTNEAYTLSKAATAVFSHDFNLEITLKQIADLTLKSFEADIVTIYRLGIGTLSPLPNVIVAGHCDFPEKMGNVISENHTLRELISKKITTYYSENSQQDGILVDQIHKDNITNEEILLADLCFIKREKIKSTIYIALGINDEIVGALFINFRDKQVFTDQIKSKVLAYCYVVSLGLYLKRKVEIKKGPLAGHSSLFHSQMQAGIEYVRKELFVDNVNDEPTDEFYSHIVSGFRDLHERWTGLSLYQESFNPIDSTISSRIAKLQQIINASYKNVRINKKINPEVDYLDDELKSLIFNIIAEAVANALMHGKAKDIEIKLQKQSENLELQIKNNGCVPDIDLSSCIQKGKKTGIGALLYEAKIWFAAEPKIEVRNGWIYVEVIFPMLFWRSDV